LAGTLSADLRWTTTTKRSGLPMTVFAMSKSSNVRQEARIVLASVVKLMSSG